MGVISPRLAGGRCVCFTLTARGVKAFAVRTGESAALEGGEDGALTAESDCVLETEETDW